MTALLKNTLTLFAVIVLLGSCNQKDKIDKVLHVKEIAATGDITIQEVSDFLEKEVDLQQIDLINWQKFPYQPKVQFRIAHGNNQIWLKFYVEEEEILAHYNTTNSSTHKDSCVEFFLDPLQDGNYYNFEFNCIGTTHLAYGPDRKQRKFIDPQLIADKIQTESSLGNQPFELKSGGFSWEMTVIIPVGVLVNHKDIQLKGIQSNANFYKCGDKTSTPHFLSWNPVGTEGPDFHQPQYFGTLTFE